MPEPLEDLPRDSTKWPTLSPEIGVVVPHDPGIDLPQAWQAVRAPDMSKRATSAQLKQWLGPQAWKISRGSHVGLVELYTGRGRLSDAYENLCEGSEAIRLGHMYGQELRSPEGQWFTKSLIELCKPDDVFVSFPCKGWGRWSSFNERREPGTRLKILRERLEGRKDLNLLFQIADLQSGGQRHTHAENPQSSLAWSVEGFAKFRGAHGFVTFDQCPFGLRHPRSGRPIRKATAIFTTRFGLAEHMSQFRCACRIPHDRAEGTFQGRSVTTWCEDYTERLARALVQGMRPDLVEPDTVLEPPHYDEHIQSNPVERCFVGHDNIIHRAFPVGEPTNPVHDRSEEAIPPASSKPEAASTVFKVTDPEISKQLTLLQFPGRYQKLDLPLPVQTQLQVWSGLEVNTVMTGQRLKCFMNPPTGVVTTRRITLARSGGKWYYVEYNRDIGNDRRKLRLPLNASLVVTFFGEIAKSPQPGVPPEAQPVEQPLPGAPQAFSSARKVHEYSNRLHVGLGHPGQSEFLQHLRDAGAAPWLLQQAARFTCAVCSAQKPPPPRNVVGGPKPRSFNSILTIDTLDLTLVRNSVQHRVFLLTAVDTATSFARVFHLASGEATAAIQALKGGWLDSYGAPEFIYAVLS